MLFVCTGNICRSPIAERLVTGGSPQARGRDLTASSAGLQAVVGHPIHPNAVRVIEAFGGNTSNFAARQLSREIATDADLILTMTRSQRDAVLALVPQKLHRTFSLGEAALLAADRQLESLSKMGMLRSRLVAEKVPEVPDPIGKDPDFFAKVGEQISELLQPITGFIARIGDHPTA